MDSNDRIFSELILIYNELLMIQKILLKQVPENYEQLLDEKKEAHDELMENVLNALKGNGGEDNG